MRVWWTALLVACAAGDTDAQKDTDVVVDTDRVVETDAPVPDDANWHRDVRPIAEIACAGCHQQEGIGPFVMELDGPAWASGAPGWAPGAVAAVQAGSMPPWHASDDCHPIEGSRALGERDLAIWTAWKDNGYAVGNTADYQPRVQPVPPSLGAPDLVLQGEAPYTASRVVPDDYHCLPLGDPFEADTLIKAIQVRPDQAALVHHAILYLVNPDKVEEVATLDEAEPGPGYTCFGGPLRSDAGISGSTYQNLHTWVPGNVPEVLPDGDARRIVAGAQLVMQVHYNTLSVPAGQTPPADATDAALWRYEGKVLGIIQTVPLANYGIVIEPGDPASTHTTTFAFGTPALITGMMPHMHYLGRSLQVNAISGGGTRKCMVDVPDWDFNWQQSYAFPVVQPFVLGARDTVELTCTYDNSAANQPVVNGTQLEPRQVTWGEGTLDEMCLAYANVRFSGAAGGIEGCGPFQSCFTICPEGDGECLATCLAGSINDCTVCGLLELGSCAVASCSSEGVALFACLDDCPDGQLDCLIGDCRVQTESYLACQDPHVRDGDCNAYLDTCDISF